MLNFLNQIALNKYKREDERKEKERISKLKKKYMPITVILSILALFTSYKIGDFLSNKKILIGIITLIFFSYNYYKNRILLISYEKILPQFILSGYLTFLLHFKPEQKMKLLKIIIGFIALEFYESII